MAQSLWDRQTRRKLQSRLATLTPQTRRRWGKMSAPEMVTHLADSLRMAIGELPCAPTTTPLRYFPIKQFVVYWAPWPKGAPTAPELIARVPASWTTEITGLTALVDRVAARGPDGPFADHPAFGTLTGRAWGVLMYRHIEHHLRQFGA
jgi:DinB family protein